MTVKILKQFNSQNFDNRSKNTKIKYIILHYTETENLKQAVNILCDKIQICINQNVDIITKDREELNLLNQKENNTEKCHVGPRQIYEMPAFMSIFLRSKIGHGAQELAPVRGSKGFPAASAPLGPRELGGSLYLCTRWSQRRD